VAFWWRCSTDTRAVAKSRFGFQPPRPCMVRHAGSGRQTQIHI